MPYITLGTASQLQIQIPTQFTTNWADTLRTNLFLKVAEHDHTGSGKGSQLGANAIQSNAIGAAKIRLENDTALRGRNAANSADVDILKVTSSNFISILTDLSQVNLTNDTYLKGRNAANSAYINLAKINASNLIEFGATVAAFTSQTITAPQVTGNKSATLNDNTAVAADASIITLSAGESAKVHYKMVRNSVIETGTLTLYYPDSWSHRLTAAALVGVTFSLDSGVLKYVSTSTGNNISINAFIVKE